MDMIDPVHYLNAIADFFAANSIGMIIYTTALTLTGIMFVINLALSFGPGMGMGSKELVLKTIVAVAFIVPAGYDQAVNAPREAWGLAYDFSSGVVMNTITDQIDNVIAIFNGPARELNDAESVVSTITEVGVESAISLTTAKAMLNSALNNGAVSRGLGVVGKFAKRLQMFVVPVLSLYAYTIFFSGLTLYLMTALSPFVALALFTPIGWRAVVHYFGLCFSSILFILIAPVVLGLFIDSAIVQPLAQAMQTIEDTSSEVNAALNTGIGVDADGAIVNPGAWYAPIVNGVTSGLVDVVADLAGLANGLLTGIGFVLMGLLFSILVAFGFEHAMSKVAAGFISGGGMSAGAGGFIAGLMAGGRGSQTSSKSSSSSSAKPSIPVITPSEVIYPPGNSLVPVSKRD